MSPRTCRLQGKLDPVVGRVNEIDRVIQILGRRTKNNPCLVGEPGVGKTAVAEGLAQKIANSDVPETIEGKQVVTLDMGLLVAGTKYRGEFEERLKKLMDEIKQNDDIILVRVPATADSICCARCVRQCLAARRTISAASWAAVCDIQHQNSGSAPRGCAAACSAAQCTSATYTTAHDNQQLADKPLAASMITL